MNTTSLPDSVNTLLRSRGLKLVLLGLQLGFLAIKYLSADWEKQHIQGAEEKKKLLTLEQK